MINFFPTLTVNDQIEHHVNMLLQEEELPADARQRATRFIQSGDLTQLMELPLDPEEMIQAGRVILQAPSTTHALSSGESYPILSEATRYHLHALVNEGGECAEAALFVLSQDLKARAFNRTLLDPALS